MNKTGVADLRPLEGMDLRFLWINPEQITHGINLVRGMTNMNQIGTTEGIIEAKEFRIKWDTGGFATKPNRVAGD